MPEEIPQLIITSRVRGLCNRNEKFCPPEFLKLLNAFVYDKIVAACDVHNGGRKTLDATVAGFVGIKPKSIHIAA